jgi:hypothetical protein
MVVVVEPAVKCSAAVVVASVDADACPLVIQRAVEPFHFAVGGGMIRLRARVPNAELGTEIAPREAAIAVAVVG